MRGRAAPFAASFLILASVLVACGGAPGPTLTPPADAVVIVAEGTAFTTQNVTTPSSASFAPFTLWFYNKDHELHNVHIWDAAGGSVFEGEVFTGPDARTALVPPLPTGTYRFSCDIHPGMTGQLTVAL